MIVSGMKRIISLPKHFEFYENLPVSVGIKHPSNVDNNVACLEDSLITGPHNLSFTISREGSEHGTC